MSKLSAQKKAAEERLAAAKAKLSADDRAEIVERAAIDKMLDEAKEEEESARQLDLQRRLEAARAADPEGRFESVAIEGIPDSFIVRKNAQAHTKWENETARAAQKGDHAVARRNYAAAVIHDWNGTVRSAEDSEFTHRLTKFLTDNPGVAVPIADAAVRLAGAAAVERKS